MPRQNLTANACTVCRKKRTKCDGRQPCRRCVSRGEECIYEDKMWRTKDHLRSEIERLRKEVNQCQNLIKALTVGGTQEDWKNIQAQMHRGEPPERIAAWIHSSRSPSGLRQQESPVEREEQPTWSRESSSQFISPESSSTSNRHHGIAPSDATISPQSSPEDNHVTLSPTTISPTASGMSGRSVRSTRSFHRPAISQRSHSPTVPRNMPSWTGVPQDAELQCRLLIHYFDHCFSDFSFVSKNPFMKDLNEGKGTYCSPALLNAMLGLACQSYNSSSETVSENCPSTDFLGQAKQLLKRTDGHINMTDIQATGILALAEANIGNDEAAYQLATDCVRKTVLWKLRMDSKVQTEDAGQREAMAITFCGAFSLVRIFRILTGRLSCQTGPLFMRLTPDNNDSAVDSPAARVERGVALQQHFFSQLDLCPDLLKFINSVTEIAHTFCTYHHDDGVAPADLVPAYDKCLKAWSVFRNWSTGNDEMDKDVLFAQVWYNYILTVLFSTLIDVEVDLGAGITPKAVVIQASESIIYLAAMYQEQCGFLSVHPLLPHMVFAATLVQQRKAFDHDDQFKLSPGNKRKHSEPLTPRQGRARQSRSPSHGHVTHPSNLILPSWKQHILPSTLRQSGISTNPQPGCSPSSLTSYVWHSKPASDLAAEGTLYLTKIGITNRKAAELAKALRAAQQATTSQSLRPPVPVLAVQQGSHQSASLWTPTTTTNWDTVHWGAHGGIDPAFNGLGVDDLQGFAAVMDAGGGGVGSGLAGLGHGNGAGEYILDNGLGIHTQHDELLGRGVGEEASGSSFGGLYGYQGFSGTTVPLLGGVGGEMLGYGSRKVDPGGGVGVSSFMGGMGRSQEGQGMG